MRLKLLFILLLFYLVIFSLSWGQFENPQPNFTKIPS